MAEIAEVDIAGVDYDRVTQRGRPTQGGPKMWAFKRRGPTFLAHPDLLI